jgi:hypothetical protein
MRLIAAIPVVVALVLVPAGFTEAQAESSRKQVSVKKKTKPPARARVQRAKPQTKEPGFLRIP